MQVLSPIYSVNSPNWNYNVPKQNKVSHPAFGSAVGKISIYEKLLRKFSDLFVYSCKSMPDTAKDIKYTENNSLLRFTMQLENGNQLAVTRFFPDRNFEKRPYVVVKEIGNGAFKDYIGIDPTRGKLIVLDRVEKTKALYERGYFKDIPLYDERHAIYESQLESYLKEMFPEYTEMLRKQKDNSIKPIKQVKENVVSPNPLPTKKVDEVKLPDTATNASESAVKGSENKIEELKRLKAIISAKDIIPDEKIKLEADGLKGILEKAEELPIEKEKIPPVTSKTDLVPVLKSAGVLDKSIQDGILKINELVRTLSELRLKASMDAYKREKLHYFKLHYEPIVYKGDGTDRGFVFKFKNNETLKVANYKKTERYTRIIHTDETGKETLYLIEDNSRVISNIQKKMMNIPKKTVVYKTDDELKELPIGEYVKFLVEKLEKYLADSNEAINKPYNVFKKRVAEEMSAKASKVPEASDSAASTVTEQSDKISSEISRKIENTEEMQAVPTEINKGKISDDIIKEVEERARIDAKKMAQRYGEVFLEQFKKSIDDYITQFRMNLENLFNNQ